MSEDHGKVWWCELMTRDIPGVTQFYQSVCGWTVDRTATPEGEYYLCLKGDEPVAGIMDVSAMPNLDGTGSTWFTYLAVDDLDAALREAEAAGGVVQRRPFDIPLAGRIAIVTDPGGAPVGLITPEMVVEPE